MIPTLVLAEFDVEASSWDDLRWELVVGAFSLVAAILSQEATALAAL